MQQDNPAAVRSEFDQDFASAFDAASRADALEWARQFSGGAQAAPEAAAAPAAADGKTLPEAREDLGVGRDIGIGIMSSPRSALRGAVKGANNMLGFLQDLEKLTPQLSLLNEEGEYSYPRITTVRESRERLNKRAAAAGENPIDLEAPTIPVPDAPAVPTVTGNIVETISQFLVGFKGADKIIKGGSAAANIAKGAVADLLAFDKHEERLSNVIESVPALQNPVTEFLAADPEDGAAEATFKQAVEGLALGGIGEGLFRGVAALKRGKAAAEDMKAAGKKPEDIFQTPREEAAGIGVEGKNFDFLGDASDEALLRRRQQKLADAEDEVIGAFGKPKQIADGPAAHIDDFEINFARIEGPDDIKRLMDDMVNKPELKPSIDAARRGKRGAEQTLKAAQDIDGFDSLMARRTGDAFNAEQIVAARKVYYDTTEKLMEAARRAASPDASDIDVFNFRRLVTMHHAVQKEFMGVRAEAGRALAAWRMPLGGTGADNARMLEQMLEESGGAKVGKALAAKIAAAGDSLNTAQLNKITEKGAFARSREAVSQLWLQGILTNPTTHVVNLLDSYTTGMMLGMERFAAAYPKDSPVELREGISFFAGWLNAHKMAFKNAAASFRTGEVGMGMGKIDLPRTPAWSREILDPKGKAGWLSKATEGYGLVLGKFSTNLLAAGDEFNKTLMFNAQMQALATRQGIAQGLEGQALKEHIARAMTDPAAAPLRAEAVDFANYATYTKQLEQGIVKDYQQFVNRNPMARFATPFIRTPYNIFKFTFSRTPLGLLSQNIRDDISAGGIRAATAQTRMAMGTGIIAIAADMSMNGVITGNGPTDPGVRSALRRTGWQPNSIKIGDTYYSYQRMGYLGTMLGMSADIAEILTNYEAYDIDMQEDVEQLVAAAAIAASNQVMGKTFMQGFADLTAVLSDPKREVGAWSRRMAGSFVPAGVAAVERAIDPETSEVFNMLDAMRARIPGLSAMAPVRRNIWGEPIEAFYPEATTIAGATAERLATLFNPVYTSREKDAPVDRWLLQNGFTIDMPQKTQVFKLPGIPDNPLEGDSRSARIDLRDFPKAYDRLVELRGDGIQLMKYGNQTMKEFFGNLASEQDPFGRHLSFFMAVGNSHDDQQNFIRSVVTDYAKAAREQVLDEFPEIGQAILKEMDKQQRLNDVRQPIRAGGEE